jgi:signal transduction histidine kinase
LTLEVERRQWVEDALRRSEQRQRVLLKNARHMQAQLRHLSHRVLAAQEEERKRISRELHDQITQTLVGISVQLETLVRVAALSPRQFKRRITRTQKLVERSVAIVHEFARELRPTSLDDLGLIPALHSYLKDFAKRTGIRVHFTAFAGVEQLGPRRRTALYRVAQAALTNVAQHARASRVTVSIRKQRDTVCMEIADDGEAFDVGAAPLTRGRKRLGLLGMRERMEMIGGQLDVESAPGQGTTIRAQVRHGKDRTST